MPEKLDLEAYFKNFRLNTIGHDLRIQTPYGQFDMLYADWTASGRMYKPIEEFMMREIYPLVGNTHTGSTATGVAMTEAYHYARSLIKAHLGAGPADVLITAGSGMTGVVVKLQRLLQIKAPDWALAKINLRPSDRPVVFLTHQEHNSNQLSWLATIADVVVVPPDSNGLFSLSALEQLLIEYKDRPLKIGSFSGGSNVTGICPPIHDIAALMHLHGGLCFVDYAASAPYVSINMHPENPLEALDAVFLSPHKMLGGPGSPGLMVMNSALLTSPSPDIPGGGPVRWTNPWGGVSWVDDREAKEDAGTPAFLQTIKAGQAFLLKEQMGIYNIAERKGQLLTLLFEELDSVPGLSIMANSIRDRQPIVSFILEGAHYALVVKLLNDRFGIQSRGGCSCAGTLGHILFGISADRSAHICAAIDAGDNSLKPGWTRLSLHPTNTFDEVRLMGEALRQIAANSNKWGQDYVYDKTINEYRHKG